MKFCHVPGGSLLLSYVIAGTSLHLTWLCPTAAGCSPPSASPIVCVMLFCSRWFAPSFLCQHRDFTSLHFTWFCPSSTDCSPPSMPSIVVCLMLSCSRWFPPSLLCHPATFCLDILLILSLSWVDRLVGLVVRRPPRERKIPGSNPACAGIFSGSSHTSDLTIGTPVATLAGAWRYRVSTGTGRPGVSIL